MTTRRDVEVLHSATSRVVAAARRDLADLFASLNLSTPEAVRDALLEVVPAIVDEYGDAAAAAAAEWYEELRGRDVGPSNYVAQLGDAIDVEQVQRSVRAKSGHLWTEDPQQTLATLSQSIQRYILYSARGTVARNAEHDPAKPRFARVPRGATTCAFCSMMASRGFVYKTRATAGDRDAGDEFHDDCDCQIVAEFDREAHHITGYDPDAMYDRYLQARSASGASDARSILAEMRRMHPDFYTDGVIDPLS